MRRVELRFLVEMALEARFRVALRINDRIARSTAFVVDAPGPVARFTSHFLRVRPFGHQTRMVGGVEIFGDILVTLLAGLAADECRAFDVRWDNDGPLHRCARNHRHSGS